MASDSSPDVWMPLLIDRYLGDTTMLTTEQHGAYVLLLMTMWKARGVLPDDDAKLAQAARLTPTRWRGIRDTIRPFFRSDGNGGLVQKRLMIELRRAEQRSMAGQTAGRASARKRNDHGNDPPTNVQRTSQRNANELPNEQGNGSATISQLPTQTPTPSSGDLRPNGLSPPSAREGATEAGLVCKAMKEAGIGQCSPGDPRLLALIAQGATLHEFQHAAEKAVRNPRAKHKFEYALEVLQGERADAAAVVLAPSAPARPGSMAEFNRQLTELKGQA